jgi:two-component system chemotaxis sensor kinase CheA
VTAILAVRVLLFLSLALTVYLVKVTIERCRSEKRFNFIYCLVGIFCYNLGYFIEMTSGSLQGGMIAIKIMYMGSCFMPVMFLFFVADYCEAGLQKRRYKIPLLIVPAVMYILVATFEYHKLIYTSVSYNSALPLNGMDITPGKLYLFPTLYSLFCIGLTCTILIRTILKTAKSRRGGLMLLLVASLAPVVAQLIYAAATIVFNNRINFTAFIMVASNAILYFTVVKNDLFDLAPKAYSITLDLIRDAFVVLDKDMNYSSFNKNALELFPALETLPKGSAITKLPDWPEALSEPEPSGGAGEDTRKEKEFTLPRKPGRNYSGWVNAVAGEDKKTVGWVVLIQDITQTVNLINGIQAQRDEIAAMRDNLKEGLFLLDKDRVIQPSYSRALENVLSGKDLQGKDFVDLLEKSYSPKDLETVRDYFNMLFDGSVDAETLEDINPLEEFKYISTETGEHKTLRGLFTPIDQGKGETFILGTFQDITAEAELKKKLAEEESRRQDEMRTIFELLQVEHQVFNNFTEDADYEFERINNTLKNAKLSPKDLLVEIYQSVHAIKSNSLIVGLVSFGEKLHRLESELKELRDKDHVVFDDLLHITVELENRMKDRDKFLDIIKRLKTFNSGDIENVKSDKDVFVETLSQACEKAAADLGKKARFVVDSFDGGVLDSGQRRVMKEILTQLVRNSVSHGIEPPEERKAKGKDETGTISLALSTGNGGIHIILKDDGKGLCFEKIAASALAKGLIKETEKTDRKALTQVIFMPGFSTSETENMHSGRGIGLNLVRDRLRELHGTMRLQNSAGGLVFDIFIPAA